jgi:hypothetical protein
MKIEGVPEGYQLERIGIPKDGELYLRGRSGFVEEYDESVHYSSVHAIVRKIERLKQYRPFANAEEFKPHRDRWTRRIAYDPRAKDIYPPKRYNESECDGMPWAWCFENFTFDDGSPFGVEVSE